jgi:CheY-like chemotaxis protein
VLIVEDDADVVDLLRYNLSKAGFGVLIARDGLKGLEIARKDRPDLVVLDLRIPQMDGYAVFKALKNDSDTAALPIVILTARAEPRERVHGLEIGADDYMTKPFSPRELVLRVQALLRRSRSGAQNDVLEVDNFQVDRNSFGIRLEGRRLDLTTTEFKSRIISPFVFTMLVAEIAGSTAQALLRTAAQARARHGTRPAWEWRGYQNARPFRGDLRCSLWSRASARRRWRPHWPLPALPFYTEHTTAPRNPPVQAARIGR